ARSSRTPRAATSPSVCTARTGQPTTSPATSATGRTPTLPTGTTLPSTNPAPSSGAWNLQQQLPLPLGEGRGEGALAADTSRHRGKTVAVVAANQLVQL